MPLYDKPQFQIAQHICQRQQTCEHCDGKNEYETLAFWSYRLTLHIPSMGRGIQCQAWQHYCCTEDHAWQAQLVCQEQHLPARWEGKTWTEEEQRELALLTVPVLCEVCRTEHPANESIQFILGLAHTGHAAIAGFKCDEEHIVCGWDHLLQALNTCHEQHILAPSQQKYTLLQQWLAAQAEAAQATIPPPSSDTE